MDALPQDNHLQMRSYYFPPFKNCIQPFSRICFYYEACVPVCHEKSSCCLFPAFSAADCACFNKDSSLADYLGIAVKSKLASGMEFLASHEGPYLIHCIPPGIFYAKNMARTPGRSRMIRMAIYAMPLSTGNALIFPLSLKETEASEKSVNPRAIP